MAHGSREGSLAEVEEYRIEIKFVRHAHAHSAQPNHQLEKRMEEDDMDMDVDTCLRGFWKDGICLCDSGYATLFSESYHLRPLYCDHHLSDLDTETTWEMDGMEFLSYAVMAVSFLLCYTARVHYSKMSYESSIDSQLHPIATQTIFLHTDK